MKKIQFLPLFSSLLLLFSCKTVTEEYTTSPRDPEKGEPTIESISNYHLVTYKRMIDMSKDKDFITPAVKSSLLSCRMYRDASSTKSDGVSTSDTLSFSEQIPFSADVSELTRIYKDGSSEYNQSTDLDPNSNPLLSLRDEPLDLKYFVSKVEIKDGMSTTYNNVGEILSQKQVTMPDYSEYLKEISKEKQASSEETKSGIKRDINWLRRKMEMQATKSGVALSYRIYETEGGKVVLEQEMPTTKGCDAITVRTFLSSDISQNYGYEKLVGGQLTVRCTHSFAGSSTRTKSVGLSSGEISEENPTETLTEELCTLNDGTPVISVSTRTYKVNKTTYNLK